MEKKILLMFCIIIMFLAGMAQALIDPPELIIVEKPDYVELFIDSGMLIPRGLYGHEIQIIKSPMIKGSEKEEIFKKAINEDQIFRLSEYGDFELLIDQKDKLSFSYGRKILEANAYHENLQKGLFYSGIITTILGAILLAATAILRTKKMWKIVSMAIIAIGLFLLLEHWIFGAINL